MTAKHVKQYDFLSGVFKVKYRLFLKRLKMLLQFIREHIEYSLLLASICLFIISIKEQRKIARLANSGRITDILKAERNRISSKAFAIVMLIGFIITMI